MQYAHTNSMHLCIGHMKASNVEHGVFAYRNLPSSSAFYCGGFPSTGCCFVVLCSEQRCCLSMVAPLCFIFSQADKSLRIDQYRIIFCGAGMELVY